MFSCDYNGWADVPEEEREAIQVFEASTQLERPFDLLPPPLLPGGIPPQSLKRRAA